MDRSINGDKKPQITTSVFFYFFFCNVSPALHQSTSPPSCTDYNRAVLVAERDNAPLLLYGRWHILHKNPSTSAFRSPMLVILIRRRPMGRSVEEESGVRRTSLSDEASETPS